MINATCFFKELTTCGLILTSLYYYIVWNADTNYKLIRKFNYETVNMEII